jgi:hypothetical protein
MSGNVATTAVPMESPPSQPQAASGLRAERADAASNATAAKDLAATAPASAPTAVTGTQDVPARAAARPLPSAATGSGAPVEKRATDPAPLPVDEWIALIRRLRAEGRIDVAAKELRAFRAAHADHERLLPPDLRDWRPPEN